MKRVIAIVLSVVMLISAIPFAYAANNEVVENEEFVDYIVQNGARYTTKPTVKWDLSNATYHGSFSGVKAGVYTNYYFTGVTYITVSFFNLRTDFEQCKFEFALTDLTDSYGSSGFRDVDLDGSDTVGTDAYGSYTGLNSNHKYCIFMRTVQPDEAASGDIYVNGG